MTNCISCLSDELSVMGDYVYESEIFAEYFPSLKILKCNSCDLTQIDHSEINNNKLTLYYEDNYRKDVGIATKHTLGVDEYFTARGRTLVNLSKKFKSTGSVKNVIEVGAGYGYNLVQFMRFYRDAEFYADELNKEILPADVRLGRLSHNKYDIVLLSHVLEHFVNPIDLLSQSINALTKSGILVIEVPNEGGGVICQSHNGKLFHEPHITFFGLTTISSFIKNNCQDVSIKYIGTCGPLIEDVVSKRNSCLVKVRCWFKVMLSKSALVYKVTRKVKNILFLKAEDNDYGLSTYSKNDNRFFVRVVLQKR